MFPFFIIPWIHWAINREDLPEIDSSKETLKTAIYFAIITPIWFGLGIWFIPNIVSAGNPTFDIGLIKMVICILVWLAVYAAAGVIGIKKIFK